MISGFMLWNEPNNLSHWDFEIDSEWKQFSEMTRNAAERIKKIRPDLKLILGGISPIDPSFIQMLDSYGTLENLDAVAIHGFPIDWNHWSIYEWPRKVEQIERVTDLPVWVTEVGVSTFGDDDVQVLGLKKTSELLVNHVENIFWYSLLDLPPAWEAMTRHKEAEGSSYYRHFYMGLIRADGTEKPSIKHFNPEMGICQWFHYQDHRLEFAIEWLKKLGVKKIRTGISWADWLKPNSVEWFDRQMQALEDFDVTITLCFTPLSKGIRACYTSPPVVLSEFANFAEEVVTRYCPAVNPPEIDSDKINFNRKDENEENKDSHSRYGKLCKFTATGD